MTGKGQQAMRLALFIVLLGAAGLSAAPAKADPYPWCAVFSGDLGGVRSCSFTTFQQCLATVSGVGGSCTQSPWYTGNRRTSTRRRARPLF